MLDSRPNADQMLAEVLVFNMYHESWLTKVLHEYI